MISRLRRKDLRPKRRRETAYSFCRRLIVKREFGRAVDVMGKAVYDYAFGLAKQLGESLDPPLEVDSFLLGLERKGLITGAEFSRLTVLKMVVDGLGVEVHEESGSLELNDAEYLREYAFLLERIGQRGKPPVKETCPSHPHAFLVEYLVKNGFRVYPREMVCGAVGCPFERNRLVDVAATKDGKLYAFEYKSSGDGLMRAVKQSENYRRSFDYVVLVAEVPRYDFSLNTTRGVRIKEFLRIGVGLWAVRFIGGEAEISIIRDPQLQSPVPQNRDWVELKFKHNVKVLSKQAVDNKQLTDFA
jgi:hypothetical protein